MCKLLFSVTPIAHTNNSLVLQSLSVSGYVYEFTGCDFHWRRWLTADRVMMWVKRSSAKCPKFV